MNGLLKYDRKPSKSNDWTCCQKYGYEASPPPPPFFSKQTMTAI